MVTKATSLSAQLKRLQVPQASLLSNVADRRRVSFLYDPKEAANLDSEAVYCLAMNGLEELKSIDAETFESFELTLFNSTSITYERAIQSKQDNQKLNSEIRRFLIHLSPYFMLKPAHKAFEWLVYRYQIHSYNVNDLFMCILPYHETNYFVRALQMINLDKQQKQAGNNEAGSSGYLWSWLVENQKQGVPLASTSVATHLFSDLSFLNFIIKYLEECLEQFANESQNSLSISHERNMNNALNFSVSFFTKLLMQSLKQLSLNAQQSGGQQDRKNLIAKQQETFLSQLIPVLLDGFKSSILPYKQSSYLLASILFEKFKLNKETTSKTLFAIAKGLSTFRVEKISNHFDDVDDDDINGNDDRQQKNNSSISKMSYEDRLSKYYSPESLDCIKCALLSICLIVQSQFEERAELIKATTSFMDESANMVSSFELNKNPLLMSKSFMRKFMKNLNKPEQLLFFVNTLDQLNQVYRIDKYLKCLLCRLINDFIDSDKSNEDALNKMEIDLDGDDDGEDGNHKMKEDEQAALKTGARNHLFDLLMNLIGTLNLNNNSDSQLAEFVIDYSFGSLINHLNEQKQTRMLSMSNTVVEYHLCELIAKLEAKYPREFDRCLNKLLVSGDGESSILKFVDQEQRNYFLTTISCKFSTFKCKSTFKYQQLSSNSSKKTTTKGSGDQSRSSVDYAGEYNLLIALNHSNPAIRSNALNQILIKIKEAEATKSVDDLDDEFIKSQLEAKFASESSTIVIQALINYNVRLLNYIDLDRLIESCLLKYFDMINISPSDLESEELNELIERQNVDWLECRQMLIELIFDDLYAKHPDRKDLFFNTFLVILSKLFSISSSSSNLLLINRLQKSFYFNELQHQNHSSNSNSPTEHNTPNTTPIKPESAKSSITITKLSLINGSSGGHHVPKKNGSVDCDGDAENTNAALNEQLDSFISASVKYMLSTANKVNKNSVIKHPKCFDQLLQSAVEKQYRRLTYLDFIVFEICLRICNQSLFITNASFYLKLATRFLTGTLLSNENIKIKRTKTSELTSLTATAADNSHNNNEKRFVLLNSYHQIIRKQAIKSGGQILVGLYQSLIKSITIQMSNFVKSDIKKDLEELLNEIYVSLCVKSRDDPVYNFILIQRFIQSNCFNFQQQQQQQQQTSPPHPIVTNNNSKSGLNANFFSFIMKFLIQIKATESESESESEALLATQMKTIDLFSAHIKELIAHDASHESSIIDALILLISWCLTSQQQIVRCNALELLEKINQQQHQQSNSSDSFVWSTFIKKLLKHREEIEIDRVNYLSTKCLSKILNDRNNAQQVNKIIEIANRFLTTNSSNCSSSSAPASLVYSKQLFKANNKQQRQMFFFSNTAESSATSFLNDLKYAILDLFKAIKDDLKLQFMDSAFKLFMANLDELNREEEQDIINQNRYQQANELIIRNYLLNSKSFEYFNENESAFKLLISFLNQSKSANLMKDSHKQSMEKFVQSLADLNEKNDFFKNLSPKNQMELVKCFMDIWMSKSFRWSSPINEEECHHTTNDLDKNQVRKCLLAFSLRPAHYNSLFVEKANLKLKLNTNLSSSSSASSTTTSNDAVATTKELKKQMLTKTTTANQSAADIDWKYLKSIVELIQLNLVNLESKSDGTEMDQDDAVAESLLSKQHQMTADQERAIEESIELIPTLFAILELADKNEESGGNFLKEAIINNDKEEEQSGDLLDFNLVEYLEIICLNSLLIIYKLNTDKGASTATKLTQVNFNIELLMKMLQTSKKHDEKSDSENHHRVEEMIIRDNKSQQIIIKRLENNLNVQEHILLLLSQVASLIPDKVLEHVLIMFVFVGDKLARRDDAYSFQIINKTIRSILPAIVNNSKANFESEQQQKQLEKNNSSNRLSKTVNVIQRHQKQLPYVSSLVCKILQSFVVSLPHIPAHRKTIIFNQLLNIVGLDEYLWITIIQSIDYYLIKSNDLLDFTNYLEQMTLKQHGHEDTKITGEKKVRDILKQCIQSMVSLHVQFNPASLIKSCIYLTTFLNKYLTSLFDKALKLTTAGGKQLAAANTTKPIYSHLACKLDDYNLLQMKYLAYNMLTFVNDLLVSEELIAKLAEIYEDKQMKMAQSGGDEDFSQLFQNLLEKILLLILKLGQTYHQFENQNQQQQQQQNKSSSLSLSSSSSSSSSSNNHQQANQVIITDIRKFHKALLNKSYDLMERTISLLNSQQFINVLRHLIKHDHMQIRRRVLNLLNNKLRKYEPTSQETTLLIGMIDDLLNSMILNSNNKNSILMLENRMETDENNSDENNNNDMLLVNKEITAQDVEIHNQTILFSMKLMCKRIGEQNPLAFVKVIKFLSENLIDEHLFIFKSATTAVASSTPVIRNVNFLSSLLLCIGELCLKLKSNALIYLNQIMSFIFKIVDTVNKNTSALSDDLVSLDSMLDENMFMDEFESKNSKHFKLHELLMLSVITCLLKIVQNMANFLSPYLAHLVYLSCSLSQKFDINLSSNSKNNGDGGIFASITTKSSQIGEQQPTANQKISTNHSLILIRLANLRSSIATLIPLRLLAPILNDQSTHVSIDESTTTSAGSSASAANSTTSDHQMDASANNKQIHKVKIKYIEYYMQIAKLAIQKASQEDILENIRTLRSMFINVFDLRAYYDRLFKLLRKKSSSSSQQLSKNEKAAMSNELVDYLSGFEDHVLDAFCELTFKISEDVFRPIFFKLYEWSTANEPPKDRLITFYRTTHKLSDRLKSLFVLFSHHFLQNAAELLDKMNRSKTEDEKFFGSSSNGNAQKERLLLYSIVDTLANVFVYDAQKTIVSKDSFNMLMQPIVDQIDNEIEFDDYNLFISKHLAPCIANLGLVSAHDETLTRKFNYQILLKTKSDSVRVRLAALDVLGAFSQKLGDVFNSLLSETVPFLAELMEDPSDEVEAKVQNLIKDLEDMLGESLQSHFV